jgi:hypothetical protein
VEIYDCSLLYGKMQTFSIQQLYNSLEALHLDMRWCGCKS